MLEPMRISDKGLALIREFEGLRLTVYSDSRGLPTIGIGHKLTAGESYPIGITEAQAYDLLRKDVAWAEHVVNVYVHVALTQDAFDALVSFAYNVGSGTFHGSDVLSLVNAEELDKAAQAMLNYSHAEGELIDGLLRRRSAEARMMMMTPFV